MSEEISPVVATIAREMRVKAVQVHHAVRLLDEGATVPFIARYRKQETGELDDAQLRYLVERLLYLRDLDERRAVIIKSIREQDQLTDDLLQRIMAADTKTRLEDLYLPFRPKRRTKAQIAIEAGLEPLALALKEDPNLLPEEKALEFIQAEKDIQDVKAALEGARHILMEMLSEAPELLESLRQYLWDHFVLSSTGSSKEKETLSKFSDYFNFSQALKKIPSHRALALFRGRRESVLQLNLSLTETDITDCIQKIAQAFNWRDEKRPADPWLLETIQMTWKTKLLSKFELELLNRLRELADEEAIKVFSKNLRDLLLSAPAGPKVTMGLDPGIRTGVKTAVVDATGKLLDYTVIFPFAPQNEWHQSITELAKMAAKHRINLISIGNGTGSRETDRLVSDLIKMYPDLGLTKIIVSEAGASVYSASELASLEFPDLDVTIRGAVSIARRVQDPLAELVKIDAKSIGVGQYQHDVNQVRLGRTLQGVVEDCVNAVGVDVNTASVALLSYVSGLNEILAKNIVLYRDEHGAFTNREQLKNIQRMGEKTFQQAAGFLRIMGGDNPLDASAVHPETYSLVEKILTDKKIKLSEAIGNKALLQSLNMNEYVDEVHGLSSVRDILSELEKPGRDPRPEFKTAQFKEGVEDISHLSPGMILEGVVSNVTNFGAFVDIGVHQDGLVHISEMPNQFTKAADKHLKAGDVVTVKVIDIDKERRRISLSMKLEKEVQMPHPKREHPVKTTKNSKHKKEEKKLEPQKKSQKPLINTAMADALAKLKRNFNK